jgi:hypothetical protein
MSRPVAVLLAIALAMTLVACSSIDSVSKPKNSISAAELSAEQQEVIDLLSAPGQELMLFDFNTEDLFSGIDVTVEVYRNGELTETPAGVSTSSDTPDKLKGTIAVVMTELETGFQWAVSVSEDGRMSHTGTYEEEIGAGYSRAYGPMSNPAAITDGKEIIIYSSLFHEANTPMRAYDEQSLLERPELLDQYPLAFLIKCKFTE